MIRLLRHPSHGHSSIGRIANYFSFAFSAAIHDLFRAKAFEASYAYPPMPAALAAMLVDVVRRRPFVMDVQDLWPDSVVASGMASPGRMLSILNAMFNFAYVRAARIVTLSRGIGARLIERGVPAGKVEVIYNWANERAAAPSGTFDLTRFGFAGHFTIVYGGNLGRVQGLDTLIHAARRAALAAPELKLLLIGDGMEAPALRALVAELGATNVAIEPGVPRSEIGDVFGAADVLATHLIDDPLFEITIPQKTQFYLAMGKPVLCGVKGEAASFLLESGAGVAVEPGDVAGIAAAMVRLARTPRDELAAMGARGHGAYQRYFAFAAEVEATEKALATTIAEARL